MKGPVFYECQAYLGRSRSDSSVAVPIAAARTTHPTTPRRSLTLQERPAVLFQGTLYTRCVP